MFIADMGKEVFKPRGGTSAEVNQERVSTVLYRFVRCVLLSFPTCLT
jgi:hypothetical protein